MAELTVEQIEREKQVFEICDRLEASGDKLSTRIILTQLDGVTSTSTVHAPYKKWRELREANKQKLMENLQFSDRLAGAIAEEITQHTSSSDRRSKQMAEAANAQTQETIEDLQRVEERLHDESVLLEQAKKDKQLLNKKLETNQQSHEAIVVELRQQLEDVNNEKKDLYISNEKIRLDRAKAELKLESNQSYVDEVKAQNNDLAADNKSLNKEVAALNGTVASQGAIISGNNKLIDTYEQRQIDSKESLNKLEAERLSLRNELSITHKDLADTKDKLNTETRVVLELKKSIDEQALAADKVISSHEATISGNDKLISQLETSQSKLQNTNNTLESTNSTLSLEKSNLAEELINETQKVKELHQKVDDQDRVIKTLNKDKK